MKRLIIRLLVLAIAQSSILLAMLCSASPTLPEEASPRWVRALKLRVSPNGRYFVDQHGNPFFYLGDTAWLLF
jgi:Protein of unknown function (DUF4038)